jgi:CubicO group peptidase (beta-lactamase class C family)
MQRLQNAAFTIALFSVGIAWQQRELRADEQESAANAVAPDPVLDERLKAIVNRHKVPGLVAGIVHKTELIAVGCAGVLKSGAPELLTVNDRMHLGSCTKAMTATRIAILVEKRLLAWDSTLASIFPDDLEHVHPDLRDVTLTQLLTHRAGLPANTSWHALGTKLSTTRQRQALLRVALKAAPKTKPGTEFVYSNLGYALAGAMAEQVTGQSWEDLMRDGLFEPLKMQSAGFGVPGNTGAVDQPWGHASVLGFLSPVQHDNPPALGPAGTVHASIPDWAKFAAMHLQGTRGDSDLLKHTSFLTLQTPAENSNYAMGWLVGSPEWAGGRILAHDGSNTFWYASIYLLPERDLALLAATNRADAAAQSAIQESIRSLLGYFETNLSEHATPFDSGLDSGEK